MNARERQLAVYAAEEAALDGQGRVFGDLGEVRVYLDELVAGDWWGDRWPHLDGIRVDRSRSERWAAYTVVGAGDIRLSGAGLTEPVLLHEVAHVVAPGAGHGPDFVTALLALVRERMGFHAYGALLAELHRRRVVFSAAPGGRRSGTGR